MGNPANCVQWLLPTAGGGSSYGFIDENGSNPNIPMAYALGVVTPTRFLSLFPSGGVYRVYDALSFLMPQVGTIPVLASVSGIQSVAFDGETVWALYSSAFGLRYASINLNNMPSATWTYYASTNNRMTVSGGTLFSRGSSVGAPLCAGLSQTPIWDPATNPIPSPGYFSSRVSGSTTGMCPDGSGGILIHIPVETKASSGASFVTNATLSGVYRFSAGGANLGKIFSGNFSPIRTPTGDFWRNGTVARFDLDGTILQSYGQGSATVNPCPPRAPYAPAFTFTGGKT